MELQVQFTKRPDGVVIIRCTRPDGSVTWQRHDKQGVFYAFHDLTHFAVESVLGLRDGFFGLVAEGWNITDMSDKEMRKRMPAAPPVAEFIVNLFSTESASAAGPLTAAEFNSQLEQTIGQRPEPPLTEMQLEAIRERIAGLRRDWIATPPGSSLNLVFERSDLS